MMRVLFLMRIAGSALLVMAAIAVLGGAFWLALLPLGAATVLALIVRSWDAEMSAEWGALEEAAESVPTPWLIDTFGATESTPRDDMLAVLDVDTAWALARLHRKGVPAEYVAAHWQTGQPLDADVLVASYREGGAA